MIQEGICMLSGHPMQVSMRKHETYTAMACPPKVNRILVAPVKNCWGSRGPEYVTPGCCPPCTAVPIMYQAVKVVATNPKKEKAR